MESPENTTEMTVAAYIDFVMKMLRGSGYSGPDEAKDLEMSRIQQIMEIAAVGFKMETDLMVLEDFYGINLHLNDDFESG